MKILLTIIIITSNALNLDRESSIFLYWVVYFNLVSFVYTFNLFVYNVYNILLNKCIKICNILQYLYIRHHKRCNNLLIFFSLTIAGNIFIKDILYAILLFIDFYHHSLYLPMNNILVSNEILDVNHIWLIHVIPVISLIIIMNLILLVYTLPKLYFICIIKRWLKIINYIRIIKLCLISIYMYFLFISYGVGYYDIECIFNNQQYNDTVMFNIIVIVILLPLGIISINNMYVKFFDLGIKPRTKNVHLLNKARKKGGFKLNNIYNFFYINILPLMWFPPLAVLCYIMIPQNPYLHEVILFTLPLLGMKSFIYSYNLAKSQEWTSKSINFYKIINMNKIYNFDIINCIGLIYLNKWEYSLYDIIIFIIILSVCQAVFSKVFCKDKNITFISLLSNIVIRCCFFTCIKFVSNIIIEYCQDNKVTFKVICNNFNIFCVNENNNFSGASDEYNLDRTPNDDSNQNYSNSNYYNNSMNQAATSLEQNDSNNPIDPRLRGGYNQTHIDNNQQVNTQTRNNIPMESTSHGYHNYPSNTTYIPTTLNQDLNSQVTRTGQIPNSSLGINSQSIFNLTLPRPSAMSQGDHNSITIQGNNVRQLGTNPLFTERSNVFNTRHVGSSIPGFNYDISNLVSNYDPREIQFELRTIDGVNYRYDTHYKTYEELSLLNPSHRSFINMRQNTVNYSSINRFSLRAEVNRNFLSSDIRTNNTILRNLNNSSCETTLGTARNPSNQLTNINNPSNLQESSSAFLSRDVGESYTSNTPSSLQTSQLSSEPNRVTVSSGNIPSNNIENPIVISDRESVSSDDLYTVSRRNTPRLSSLEVSNNVQSTHDNTSVVASSSNVQESRTEQELILNKEAAESVSAFANQTTNTSTNLDKGKGINRAISPLTLESTGGKKNIDYYIKHTGIIEAPSKDSSKESIEYIRKIIANYWVGLHEWKLDTVLNNDLRYDFHKQGLKDPVNTGEIIASGNDHRKEHGSYYSHYDRNIIDWLEQIPEEYREDPKIYLDMKDRAEIEYKKSEFKTKADKDMDNIWDCPFSPRTKYLLETGNLKMGNSINGPKGKFLDVRASHWCHNYTYEVSYDKTVNNKVAEWREDPLDSESDSESVTKATAPRIIKDKQLGIGFHERIMFDILPEDIQKKFPIPNRKVTCGNEEIYILEGLQHKTESKYALYEANDKSHIESPLNKGKISVFKELERKEYLAGLKRKHDDVD